MSQNVYGLIKKLPFFGLFLTLFYQLITAPLPHLIILTNLTLKQWAFSAFLYKK